AEPTLSSDFPVLALPSTARHFDMWRAARARVCHSPLYHSPLTGRMLPLMSDVTRILEAIDQGDRQAAEELLPLVYGELRKLAAQKLAHEKPGQTLDATALVHEAYLRLVDVDKAQHWNSRGHFFAAAAEAMRRILIDGARRKQCERHGGSLQRVEMLDVEAALTVNDAHLLLLDEALTRLAAIRPAAASVVQLRFFA